MGQPHSILLEKKRSALAAAPSARVQNSQLFAQNLPTQGEIELFESKDGTEKHEENPKEKHVDDTVHQQRALSFLQKQASRVKTVPPHAAVEEVPRKNPRHGPKTEQMQQQEKVLCFYHVTKDCCITGRANVISCAVGLL